MGSSRCLLLVTSVHHGNTAQVAEAMAEVLDGEIAGPEAVPLTAISAARLVGFGSGVFYGRMHPALLGWLRGLPDVLTLSTPAFIFSTSGLPFLAWLWHWPLRRLMARKGFRLVGEFACRGFDTWGPLWLVGGLNRKHPDAHDLDRARAFARRIATFRDDRRG